MRIIFRVRSKKSMAGNLGYQRSQWFQPVFFRRKNFEFSANVSSACLRSVSSLRVTTVLKFNSLHADYISRQIKEVNGRKSWLPKKSMVSTGFFPEKKF